MNDTSLRSARACFRPEWLRPNSTINRLLKSIPIQNNNTNTIDKKWSVGPTVAPVFYNSLQNGSPLNDALSNNAKTSDNALSIGVKVNYQLSNKFFIQSIFIYKKSNLYIRNPTLYNNLLTIRLFILTFRFFCI